MNQTIYNAMLELSMAFHKTEIEGFDLTPSEEVIWSKVSEELERSAYKSTFAEDEG